MELCAKLTCSPGRTQQKLLTFSRCILRKPQSQTAGHEIHRQIFPSWSSPGHGDPIGMSFLGSSHPNPRATLPRKAPEHLKKRTEQRSWDRREVTSAPSLPLADTQLWLVLLSGKLQVTGLELQLGGAAPACLLSLCQGLGSIPSTKRSRKGERERRKGEREGREGGREDSTKAGRQVGSSS